MNLITFKPYSHAHLLRPASIRLIKKQMSLQNFELLERTAKIFSERQLSSMAYPQSHKKLLHLIARGLKQGKIPQEIAKKVTLNFLQRKLLSLAPMRENVRIVCKDGVATCNRTLLLLLNSYFREKLLHTKKDEQNIYTLDESSTLSVQTIQLLKQYYVDGGVRKDIPMNHLEELSFLAQKSTDQELQKTCTDRAKLILEEHHVSQFLEALPKDPALHENFLKERMDAIGQFLSHKKLEYKKRDTGFILSLELALELLVGNPISKNVQEFFLGLCCQTKEEILAVQTIDLSLSEKMRSKVTEMQLGSAIVYVSTEALKNVLKLFPNLKKLTLSDEKFDLLQLLETLSHSSVQELHIMNYCYNVEFTPKLLQIMRQSPIQLSFEYRLEFYFLPHASDWFQGPPYFENVNNVSKDLEITPMLQKNARLKVIFPIEGTTKRSLIEFQMK